MKHVYIKLFFLLLFSASAIFPSQILFGQTEKVAKPVPAEETVNVVDVARQSSEAILDARQIKERLISLAKLLKIKRETDSLVESVDKFMKKDKKADLEAGGIRKLETSLILLQQQKSILRRKKSDLSALLDNLVENKNILSAKLLYWKKVKAAIRGKRLGKTVENPANEVIAMLDKTIYGINKLTNITMGMVGKISALELDIDTRVSELTRMRQKKQGEILSARQPSFFSLNFHDKKSLDVSGPLAQFYNVDLKNLKNYLITNLDKVIFHMVLVFLFIFLFVRLGKVPLPLEPGKSLRYKKRLKELLLRPISSALIPGLFISVVIYPNRPLIFRDMIVLLIIPPIIILLKSIVKPLFHKYIYALAIVLVAMILYSYLPVTHLISRFLLLFISLTELVSALSFVSAFRKSYNLHKKAVQFVQVLGYGVILVIIAAVVGNIFGKVLLARYLAFSIAEMVLILLLIMVTASLVNGISVTFITSRLARRSNFIRKNKEELVKKVPRFVNFLALIILVHYILLILGWETAFSQAVGNWLWHEYRMGSITFSWGRLFVFLFIIWFSIFIARIVRDVLEEDILNKVKMEEGLPHTIALMARYTLITVGVLLAFSALGMPMSDLAIMFSALGVGIGFGLQNIFNNIVSGFILLFERPIKIGDTIEVGELVGTVRSIGIRASNIRTFDGAEIIVPNGNLISNEVVNWTLSDQRRRIEIKVNVAYDSDPEKVKKVLLRLLENHGDVAKDPKPGIYFIEMGNSALVFRVLFWTHQFGKWYSIRSNMMYDVFQALKEAGIEIPYDQLDLHIRSTEAEAVHPKSVADPERSG